MGKIVSISPGSPPPLTPEEIKSGALPICPFRMDGHGFCCQHLCAFWTKVISPENEEFSMCIFCSIAIVLNQILLMSVRGNQK